MTQAMRFDVQATERASAAFLKVAEAAERLERKLKELDRIKVEIKPKFDGSDVDAGLREMRRKVREATKNLPKAKIDVKIDGLANAERQLDQIKAKMTSLSDASAKVDVNTGGSVTRLNLLAAKMRQLKALSPLKLKVDVDTGAAMVHVLALQAALTALAGTANTVNINLNSRTFLGELAQIRREIRSIHGNIEIDTNTQQAMEELARLRVQLAELSRMQPSPVVTADTELARYRIQQIEEQLARINGRTSTARVRVDVDKSWSDAVIKIAALGRALMALKWPIGLTAAAPTLAALGGAALSAAGAVGLLPGALLGAVGAFAALKVGMSGVGDALKNLDDAKKFGESLKKLAPAAREFATAVRDIAPAWRDVKLDVQQKLFAGLGVEMKKLSASFLPAMKTGLGSIATEFNLLGKDFVGFAASTRTVENVDTIFRNTATAMQAARPAAQNLAGAFLDIAVVGSEMLPELAGQLTAATGRFRTFIDEARRSGELKQWIQGGIDTLKTLGSITVNVGSTIGSIFKAQEAAGASLLGTIDRLTEGMANWAKSAQGQQQLTAVFNEIRRTIDAIWPGLQALGVGVAQMLAAFANTGGLTAFGAAFTAVAQAVAPLLPMLGELVGGALSNLSNALSAVAAAAAPIISAFSGLMGALGPIPAAVLAMVVAFKLLGPVNAMVTALGVSLGGMATRLGASAGVVGGITKTFSALGTAIPIVGVAVVALAAAWDALTVSTDEAARAMDAGGAAAQEAAAGLASQTAAMDSLKSAGGPLGAVLRTIGSAMDLFTSSTGEARAAMTPLQQAQLDAATAANVHRIAVEQFGSASPQAQSAAEALATANDRLAAEQDKGASAAKTHADAIRDLTGAMQSQIGNALAYEQAIARTAAAHKAAGDALKANGAKSDEYKAAVLSLAQAQEQQAQSAQRQVEAAAAVVGATNGAELGLQAYNTELLRLNDGTQQGQAAFVKIASSLTTTQLGMLSATAAATGLKTEILTLPDGRTVTVVTAADTTKLEQVKVDLDQVANSPWLATISFVGDPTRVDGQLTQTIANINGQTGTITFNADNQPVMVTLGNTKYAVDATTGILKILGDPAPGEADLSGFKVKVDQTTGAVTFEAVTAPADAARDAAGQPVDAPVNLNPNTAPSDAARTEAGSPVEAPVNLTPNSAPADAARTAAAAPISSTLTINVDAGPVTAAKAAAQTPTASIHTVNVDPGPVLAAKAAAQLPTQSMHTLNADDRAVVDAKNRAQQPTQSMHTINCNDGAVTAAKSRAQQNTSSTHTIHVVVVGAAVPRAIGAYATPRAAGGYATAYANGGMRRMSAARAQIVPPRQPRVIGDRMKGDEAFIPINQAPLSKAILNTTAQRMGYNLVPQNGQAMPASGAPASVSLSSIRSAITQRGTTSSGGSLGPALRELSTALRQLSQPQQGGATVNNNFYTDLREVADDVARNARRQHALGLFG